MSCERPMCCYPSCRCDVPFEHARLDELDKGEWRDVARKLRPDWTDEQFDAAWDDVQKGKRRRALQ